MPDQPPPPKRARRTHARRSCLACRQRKARCELPDITVPSSMEPLESHLQCHRCRTLQTDCIVWDGDRKAGANNALRYGPPASTPSSASPHTTTNKTALELNEASTDPTTASEVVDIFSLWATMPRETGDPKVGSRVESRRQSSSASPGPEFESQTRNRHGFSASHASTSQKSVNQNYRSKLAMAYDRNTAQVTEIIYRSPQYAERTSITHKMIAARAPPARYDSMTPQEQSRMKALIIAHPFLDPKIAEPTPPGTKLGPTEQWLRDVATYICCRPNHTDELLASILGTCVYHSLMQTRSIYVCQALLLMASYEPIDLIFRKPSTEMEEIIDRAPGQSIFAAAFGIALSFRLDEVIPNMRSGSSAMSPTTPKEERESRLREAALWLALNNFAVALCEPGIKPRLPSSGLTQLDIETFESNVRPLLVGIHGQPPGDSKPRQKFEDLHAAALLAHAYNAKFHRRLRTYWNETELLTVKSPDYVPSTRHFCLSLKKDGEVILGEQAYDFARLPQHPALDLVTTFTRLRLFDTIGRLTTALLFSYGSHVARKHGEFAVSNILKGMNTEPASSTSCLPELNDLSEQMFRDTLILARSISRHDADLLNVIPPIAFSTAVFGATKHLVERQVFMSTNPNTRGRAKPESILAAVREGIEALRPVARNHKTSVPFIIHEVLAELIKRFAVAVDVLTWIEDNPSSSAQDPGRRQSRDAAAEASRPEFAFYPHNGAVEGQGPDQPRAAQRGSAQEISGHGGATTGHHHSLDSSGRSSTYLQTIMDDRPGATFGRTDDSQAPSGSRTDLTHEAYNAPTMQSHTETYALPPPGPMNGLGFSVEEPHLPLFNSNGYGLSSASNNEFMADFQSQSAQAASMTGLIRNEVGEVVLDLTTLFDWQNAGNEPSTSDQNGGTGTTDGSGFHW